MPKIAGKSITITTLIVLGVVVAIAWHYWHKQKPGAEDAMSPAAAKAVNIDKSMANPIFTPLYQRTDLTVQTSISAKKATMNTIPQTNGTSGTPQTTIVGIGKAPSPFGVSAYSQKYGSWHHEG